MSCDKLYELPRVAHDRKTRSLTRWGSHLAQAQSPFPAATSRTATANVVFAQCGPRSIYCGA